ncbi:MAG TPA: VanZ family protein [Bacteroidales bacterium]
MGYVYKYQSLTNINFLTTRIEIFCYNFRPNSKKSMRIVKSFWKVILWAVVVLLLSTMSGEKVNEIPLMQIPNMDKVAHFGMYFVFTFLLLFDWARYKSKALSWKQIIIYSLILVIAYGGMMELLQEIHTLHRSTDIKDFMANSAGAFTAALCYKYVSALFEKVQSGFIYKASE